MIVLVQPSSDHRLCRISQYEGLGQVTLIQTRIIYKACHDANHLEVEHQNINIPLSVCPPVCQVYILNTQFHTSGGGEWRAVEWGEIEDGTYGELCGFLHYIHIFNVLKFTIFMEK